MVGDILKSRGYLPIEQQRNVPIADKIGDGSPSTDKIGGGPSFSDTLGEYVQDVNALQKDSSTQVEKLVTGEPVDIHDVMIAAEKAKTSFSLLMELRNKALDMYREVIRMQV